MSGDGRRFGLAGARMTLFLWPQSPTEALGKLSERLAKVLQAQAVSRYALTYRVLRRDEAKLLTLTTGDDKLHLMRDAEYCVLGSDFGNILAKLKLWIPRQTYKIEGTTFLLDGQTLKVGQLSQGPTTRGLVVEYEGDLDAVLGPVRSLLSHSPEEVMLQSSQPFPQCYIDLLQRL